MPRDLAPRASNETPGAHLAVLWKASAQGAHPNRSPGTDQPRHSPVPGEAALVAPVEEVGLGTERATSGCSRRNSSRARVPPFFTPTISAGGRGCWPPSAGAPLGCGRLGPAWRARGPPRGRGRPAGNGPGGRRGSRHQAPARRAAAAHAATAARTPAQASATCRGASPRPGSGTGAAGGRASRPAPRSARGRRASLRATSGPPGSGSGREAGAGLDAPPPAAPGTRGLPRALLPRSPGCIPLGSSVFTLTRCFGRVGSRASDSGSPPPVPGRGWRGGCAGQASGPRRLVDPNLVRKGAPGQWGAPCRQSTCR